MMRAASHALFIISISTSWVPMDPYKCFEKDYPPVDTSATFYDYCKDIHGNLYKPTKPDYPAQLTSCCECLEYKCTYLHKTEVLYWKTSVSDHCCLACTNTTYKADTVIETNELDDKCKSIETQVCRKLPGHEKAKIESEFNYKACCNDDTGLQVLGTEVYQPSTCSQRTCFYEKYLPFSLWISKQILPGCDCCLRRDPKGKEYLVADGTTWVVDGKVFECCRGDIVMKTEITTHSTTHRVTTRKPAHGGNVVLITGGYNYNNKGSDLNATLHSVEIFRPNNPSYPCILPELPASYYGQSQDGGMICGGYYTRTRNNCRQWNSKERKFPSKTVHEFKPSRYFHVSWTPVSEKKETFLIGGGTSRNSSNVVKQGVIEGYKGPETLPNLPLWGACSIPDPDTDTVIITGGNTDYKSPKAPQLRVTSLYNEDGFIENFGNLTFRRMNHGCTSYIANKKRVFLVTGGYYSLTTEILKENEKKWTVLKTGNLPLPGNIYGLAGVRAATINNQVFAFGGYQVGKGSYVYISSIFKFNIDEQTWHNQSYHMSRPRGYFGISVV